MSGNSSATGRMARLGWARRGTSWPSKCPARNPTTFPRVAGVSRATAPITAALSLSASVRGSAPVRDPYEICQVNSLPRRSASGPHADPHDSGRLIPVASTLVELWQSFNRRCGAALRKLIPALSQLRFESGGGDFAAAVRHVGRASSCFVPLPSNYRFRSLTFARKPRCRKRAAATQGRVGERRASLAVRRQGKPIR